MKSTIEPVSTFIVCIDESEIPYAYVVAGTTAIDAVEGHYASLDAYCSPEYDVDHREEYSLDVFRLPNNFDEDLIEKLQDMESEELGEAVAQLAKEHAEITCETVLVIFENGEMRFE